MARRAFLVGSETEGLAGAKGDAERMAKALKDWYGFEVDLCVGADATRAGIAAGYKRLIKASERGDAALFYYSGHGGFAETDAPAGADEGLERVQCIVPADFDQTSEGDFRGITAQELALWLFRLTEKTKNATVVLDCCHAAGMVRSSLTRKSLEKPFAIGYATLKPHVEVFLTRNRDEVSRIDPWGNPHAVRLVATGQRYLAWERMNDAGESGGVLTDALLIALGEARGHQVTWQALGDRVREHVLAKALGQRPEVEGPLRRLLFDTAEGEADGSHALAYDAQSRRPVLRGGQVHGVHKGDEYAIVAPGAGFGQGAEIGTAKVLRVEAAEARVELSLAAGRSSLPAGARALLRRSAARPRAVRLEVSGGGGEPLARAIEADPLFRVIERDEPNDPALARVSVADGKIELFNPEGQLATLPLPDRVEAFDELVTNLRRLAAADRLCALESDATAGLPEGSVEVSWGRVDRGEMLPLAPAGERLEVGDFVYVKVRNRHPDKQSVYVSIIDIGLAKKTTLLTNAFPSGYELRYDQEYVFGRGPEGKVRGARLSWPEGLPEDGPRPESLVVIMADGPMNLASIERPGLTGTRGAGGTRLEQLVRQAQTGNSREVGGTRDQSRVEGYLVHHIEFHLSP